MTKRRWQREKRIFAKLVSEGRKEVAKLVKEGRQALQQNVERVRNVERISIAKV